MIPRYPAPSLGEVAGPPFTPHCNSFVAASLKKSPDDRPTAVELSQHAWLGLYCNSPPSALSTPGTEAAEAGKGEGAGGTAQVAAEFESDEAAMQAAASAQAAATAVSVSTSREVLRALLASRAQAQEDIHAADLAGGQMSARSALTDTGGCEGGGVRRR